MKKILIIFAILIFLGFIYFSNPAQMLIALKRFDVLLIFPVLFLSLFNYFLRFLRWENLLRIEKIKIERKTSALIFLSGFLMTVSPAKIGEMIKSLYLKRFGVRYRRSFPMVIAERAYDLFGILVLFAISTIFIATSTIMISGFFVLLFFLIFFIMFFKKIMNFFMKIFKKQKISMDIRKFFAKKYLIINMFLSMLAWFSECVGLYLVIAGFGLQPAILRETFVYSTGTLAGVLSMLPGGVGAAEISMGALLVQFAGIELALAASATVIIRAATLWFAVLLGAMATMVLAKKLA